MQLLLFYAGLVIICTIVLIVGLFLLIRAFLFKRKKSTGITLSLFGGIPLFFIFLFVYFAVFYVSDSECKNIFLTDMSETLPASADIIYKDFPPSFWIDYQEAFIAKMNEKDFLYLLNSFRERFPEREKKGKNVFLCTSCKDVIEKAGINKDDVIWFDSSANHRKTVGFHKEKKMLIYSKFRY